MLRSGDAAVRADQAGLGTYRVSMEGAEGSRSETLLLAMSHDVGGSHTDSTDLNLILRSIPALINLKGVCVKGHWVLFWMYDGRYGKPLHSRPR